MSSSRAGGRKDGVPRRRRQLVIKEKNIAADEFMAASIGDLQWLDLSLRDSQSHSSFDKNGLAAIHLAALHGRLNCLQLLVEKYEVDVNSQSETGWTPLHLCINKETGSRAMKCMNYLLQNGADVNSANDDNVTPVHQAASEGLLECLRILIDKNAYLNVADVRGHLPLDLARLWTHKSCARLIRTEMWKKEKQEKAEELRQLNVVKQYYGELQKEAVQQLRNEQDFYGGVAFGNWLADKGLPEKLKNMSTLQSERYPEAPTVGLEKRLRTSGGLDDCAQRMEKTTLRQEKRQFVQFSKQSNAAATNEKPNSKPPPQAKTAKQTKVKPVKVSEKGSPVKKVVKVEHPTAPNIHTQQEIWESTKAFTPYSEMTSMSGRPTRKTLWNFSTNLNSDPITNIKRKDSVGLSIHPDEMDAVLPGRANLSVKLEIAAKPKIKVTLPGGRIKSADIRMPRLPSNVITDELSGAPSDRIRIPQEFKAIHVYDIQKKKQADTQPINEIGMHLSILGDPRILRKSVSSNTHPTASPFSVFTLNNTNFPSIYTKYSRALDTLHRINPPKAFLA